VTGAFDLLKERSPLEVGGSLTIDLAAVQANYRTLAALVRPSVLAAVVKADAYGLGARAVASKLAEVGCREFFVAHLAEALDLKPTLPSAARIYVLNGLQPGAERACAWHGVIPVLNSIEQARRWADAATGGRLPAALQIDTGMGRLGLSPDELRSLAASSEIMSRLQLELVMSHLACADEEHHPANLAQATAFEQLSALLPAAMRSLAASAGAFLGPRFHHQLVRSGVFLLGSAPPWAAIRPLTVARLRARVIQVRSVGPGDGVGYGLTCVFNRAAQLATLGVGYADGWPRALGNRGFALVDGVRLPVVGRISMDSITIDITALVARGDQLRLGDEVELLGDGLKLDEVAEAAGTVSHELLARLGRRFARQYLPSPPDPGATFRKCVA
jgi:alanine racemase